MADTKEYYVEECENNKFALNSPEGTVLVLNWDEMKAIESFLRHRSWTAEIINQMEYDEDNLDFDSSEARQNFVNLCLEEIDSNLEIYGRDSYDPDIEQIVFDVAQNNGLWRD